MGSSMKFLHKLAWGSGGVSSSWGGWSRAPGSRERQQVSGVLLGVGRPWELGATML